MTKQPKQVQVLACYIHKTDGKPNGRISYLVRSSNGEDTYCTTLIDGKASGCSCPSKKPCYHMTQLEAKEAARLFAAKVLPVWTADLVKAGKLASPAKVAKVIEKAIAAKAPASKTTDLSKKGELNTGRAFHLMR